VLCVVPDCSVAALLAEDGVELCPHTVMPKAKTEQSRNASVVFILITFFPDFVLKYIYKL